MVAQVYAHINFKIFDSNYTGNYEHMDDSACLH